MKYLEVCVPIAAISKPLSYLYSANEPIEVGFRVLVPLGKREIIGVVLAISTDARPSSEKIKEIIKVIDEKALITLPQIALCRFVAEYYHAPIGEVVKLCLPALVDVPKKKLREKVAPAPIMAQAPCLSDEQQEAVKEILSGKARAFLLQGITGSGKTEVYVRVINSILAKGQSSLLIVPEIALTPNLYNYLSARLECSIVMLHSGISLAKRRDAFNDLLNKKVQVVIGARSALFAPMPDLGLIIVDEEHDSSLKQESMPRYHGRDLALWRAQNEKAMIILGSATPSLESKHNVLLGKLHELRLTKRVSGTESLPHIEVIDLKERKLVRYASKQERAISDGQGLCILSTPLKNEIAAVLERKEQVILFLNRRGYAAFAICQACGQMVRCPQCSVCMTYYQKKRMLSCHQCAYSCAAATHCSSCTEGELIFLGLGTERVEQEVKLVFPEARVERLDRSTSSTFKEVQKIIQRMNAGEIDILIGTQMIAKGHDFHGVSLVGVILADTGMAMPDFRAAEKTFQVLAQVAGRSGRGASAGKVLLQTLNPLHPAIVHAKNHDVDSFMTQEMQERKAAFQPPFCRAALLILEGKSAGDTQCAAQILQKELHDFSQSQQLKIEILGPMEAPMARLRDKYRFHLYVRAKNIKDRFLLLSYAQQHQPLLKQLQSLKSRLIIDVDPVNMM